MLSNIIWNFGYLQPALPKVLDEEEMDEEEEPIDEENYSTTLIDYVSVNLASMQEIEKIKKQNPWWYKFFYPQCKDLKGSQNN